MLTSRLWSQHLLERHISVDVLLYHQISQSIALAVGEARVAGSTRSVASATSTRSVLHSKLTKEGTQVREPHYSGSRTTLLREQRCLVGMVVQTLSHR